MISLDAADRKWWPFGSPRPGRLALLCLPYAGGAASIFRRWHREAPSALDVCPLQLPGREGRIREAAHRRMAPLVAELTGVIAPRLDGPYAIFGHSMGAIVGYELAHRLGGGGTGPRALFVSGARAPHLMKLERPMHVLPDAAFRTALRNLEGTPDSVLAHDELMDLMLPTLRADFELCETYEPAPREGLACPVVAFGGREDRAVSEAQLRAWETTTRGGFLTVTLPGGHFFLEPQSGPILDRIREVLARP